jgi:hypothetical protein
MKNLQYSAGDAEFRREVEDVICVLLFVLSRLKDSSAGILSLVSFINTGEENSHMFLFELVVQMVASSWCFMANRICLSKSATYFINGLVGSNTLKGC